MKPKGQLPSSQGSDSADPFHSNPHNIFRLFIISFHIISHLRLEDSNSGFLLD